MSRRLGFVGVAVLVAVFALAGIALATTITIDGNPTDWPGDPGQDVNGNLIDPTHTECATLSAPGCAQVNTDPNEPDIPDGYDLEQTWFTNDTTYAYFRIDSYAPITFTLDGERILFCLDTDQNTGTGYVAGICNNIGTDEVVRFRNNGGGSGAIELALLTCTSSGCSNLVWSGTSSDWAIGNHAIEIRVPVTQLGFTNGQAINLATYFDNGDSPPDDHSPDTGSTTIIVGCATTGNCSPTAVTLSSLQAQPTTSPVTPVALVGVSALALIGVILVVRRRKTA